MVKPTHLSRHFSCGAWPFGGRGSATAARLSALLQRPSLPPLPPARGQRRSARGVAERLRAQKTRRRKLKRFFSWRAAAAMGPPEISSPVCTEGVCYQRDVTDGLRLPFNIRVGTSDLTRPCTKRLNLCEAVNLKEQNFPVKTHDTENWERQ